MTPPRPTTDPELRVARDHHVARLVMRLYWSVVELVLTLRDPGQASGFDSITAGGGDDSPIEDALCWTDETRDLVEALLERRPELGTDAGGGGKLWIQAVTRVASGQLDSRPSGP